MKKIFRNNRLLIVSFVTVFGVHTFTSIPALAQGPDPVELRYVGLINNQPVFQLDFHGQAETDHYTVLVKDNGGRVLYKQNIIGKRITKKFLVTEEIGDDELSFEILSRTSGQSHSFHVHAQSRKVQHWGMARSQ